MSARSPDLDAIFGALSDPTRRAIVEQLARGDATVLELASPHAISLPAISRHLKVLEQAGLIRRDRVAQTRPCRLETEGLRQASAWAEHTRRAWEDRFERLDAYLKTLMAEEAPNPTPSPRQPKRRRANQRNPR
ncbi:MAG: metalloregulator ArsR/SmtB family transcription factor [Myxococcota bacterium]